MPGSWSDFLKLRSGPAPPPSSEAGAVRVYADTGGALRSVQSDGTDAAIGGGGGGSLPAGGTAGQALLKVSSADGDAAWSGGLVFQVLGPYAITFSDPDIFADGIIVGDALPEGSTVLDMFMVVGTPWDAGGPTPVAAIGLSKETSPPVVWSIRSVRNMQLAADGEPGSFVISHAHAPADLVPRPTLITGADARIALFVDTVCTAGTGDVYVILAAPPA
jgi:hypothetical protein